MYKYLLIVFNVVLLPVLSLVLWGVHPAPLWCYLVLFSFTGFWRVYPRMEDYPAVGVFFNLVSLLFQFFFPIMLLFMVPDSVSVWMGGIGMGLIYFAYSRWYSLRILGWMILISLYALVRSNEGTIGNSPWENSMGGIVFLPAQLILLYHAMWEWGIWILERNKGKKRGRHLGNSWY